MAIVWEQRKVGDYYDFKNGLNKGKEFFGSGTPIVNFTDVFHNRGIISQNLNGKVTLEPSEIRNYEVKKGDIFFTRTSETIEEIGYPSVMLDEAKNTVFSGFVLRGRCILNEDPLDNLFKKYVFFTEFFRNEMLRKSSMTTRALTSGTAIKGMEFLHPSGKEEQHKIGEFITSLDHLITLHQWKSKIYEMIMAITERQRKPLKIDIKMQIKAFYIVKLVYKLEIVYSFYHKIIRLRFYKVERNNNELISFKDKCLIFIIGIVNIVCFILFYHQYLICIKILSIFVKINIFITRRR